MARGIDSQFTGTAGVYYVMAQLAARNFHAAATHGNAPHVDILVSSENGARTLSVQVKTTGWAMRSRGRGDAKIPFQLQWPLGYKAAKTQHDDLYFAFVDLKDFVGDGKPDVYIIPSSYIYQYCEAWVDKVKWVRFHPEIIHVEPFKNAWDLLTGALTGNTEGDKKGNTFEIDNDNPA